MADTYQVRPSTVDGKRAPPFSPYSDNAAAMTGRGTVSNYYANKKIFAQAINPAMTHVARNESIDSIDSLPSHRSSSATWRSSITQATIPSPVSTRFSFRPKTSISSFQRSSIFNRLPQDVYDCILAELQMLHSDRLSPSCATCYLRDVVALQLTSRSWNKGVQKSLYSKIHISGSDSPAQVKKFKMKHGTRLRLLRRTLRERPMLGSVVRELTVPDPAIPPVLPSGKPNPQFIKYRDLLASLVMECPNLERFQGFYTFYNHEFDRLTHALSTRRRLKEHVWIISENEAVTERSHYQIPPGLLDDHQVYQFMHYHYAWSQLETLMFCSPGGIGVIEHELFVRVFQLLPSLKHLCISCFNGGDFMDETLLALPTLISLRLECCPGVSEYGLSRWAGTPAAQTLESLSLIDQNVQGLLTVSKILASLTRLLKFSIVQADVTLSLADDAMVFQPILASPTLRHLHWDVGPSGHYTTTKYYVDLPPTNQNIHTANSHLAASILHAGFPSLLTLRAPRDLDPPAILQGVCRPTTNASILLPADQYALPPKSRGAGSVTPDSLPTNNSLHAARIRAQSYIGAASKSEKSLCKVIITDHSNYETSRHQSTSSTYSDSTQPTDPEDLFPDPEKVRLDSGVDRALSRKTASNKELSAALISMLGTSTTEEKMMSSPRRPPPAPLTLFEYTISPFLGRICVTVSSPNSPVLNPPRFHLVPDVAGYNSDGGIIGWEDLLRLNEKGDRAFNVPALIRDGCTGSWNKGCAGGPHRWKHTERERSVEMTIKTHHFF